MSKIRIGIAGYGNLGRGVELAAAQNDDMELVGVFTRRDPSTVSTITGVKAYTMDDAVKMAGDIDVMIICGGSATDLPKQTPELAKYFNVIDSFDTHARIPEHFANVDKAAKESGRRVRVLEMRTQAPDHPALLNEEETQYLKFFILQVL